MTGSKLKATIKSKISLANGFLELSRYEIEADKHAGGTHTITWELMASGVAVAVLGFDPIRDEIVLANELRPGVLIAGNYPYTDNLIAGDVNAGESVLVAAVREMKEEANLDLVDPQFIHSGAFVSSGTTSEKIAIVIGRVDSSQAGGIHGNPNESEDVKTIVLASQVFIDRVRRAEITDLKTLVAGYWFAENHERLRRSIV